jgi:hypothetical protein
MDQPLAQDPNLTADNNVMIKAAECAIAAAFAVQKATTKTRERSKIGSRNGRAYGQENDI